MSTDANGAFTVPSHGQVLSFHRSDLRPVAKVVALDLKHLEIVMAPAERTKWNIPPCSSSNKASRIGVGFMVEVPGNVGVKEDKERFENGGWFLGFRAVGRVEMMINWWESSSLVPQEKVLLDSSEYSLRMWRSGEHSGYEARGTFKNGLVWRWVAIKNGVITYQGNSKESALVFDQMMNGVCFDKSAVTW